jgi:hypothetical protein
MSRVALPTAALAGDGTGLGAAGGEPGPSAKDDAAPPPVAATDDPFGGLAVKAKKTRLR